MLIRNRFDKGPESWCSYDYHWSIVAKGRNIFILTTWEGQGGVGGAGYVWCDETRWSADTPESPVSILPLITYASWGGRDPLDLRGADVSAHLRGDSLQLFGSKCYFWVVGLGCRWHLTGRPLDIGDGAWQAQPNRFALANDESLWHRSWAADPARPPSLDQVLSHAVSYGFSFVGFGQEPRGRLCLGEFEIRTAR